jgi:hypothetical protein
LFFSLIATWIAATSGKGALKGVQMNRIRLHDSNAPFEKQK